MNLEPCGSKKNGTDNRTGTGVFKFLLSETGTGTEGTKSFFNAEIDLVRFGEDDEEDKENDDIDFF